MSTSTPDPVLVLGAGPAGVAAAWALSKRGIPTIVLEKSQALGGLSRTVPWKSYHFDIGGHRFFTRYSRVQALWEEVLGDDLLVRPRLSRILYDGHLFDYPLRPANALRGLGPVEAARCVASFARTRARPRPEPESFQDWVTQRFGRRLFEIFFRTYTEKVWGIPCTQLSARWAAQRIKNLSLGGAIRQALLPNKDSAVTSLIEQFHYPRLGPGMFVDRMAEGVTQRGGQILREHQVIRVLHHDMKVYGVVVRDAAGDEHTLTGRAVLSSMPLTALVEALDPPAPQAVRQAARQLRYRHLLVANLELDAAHLFPDNWVYVHSPELRVGRLQNYGNWSPDLVPVPGRSVIGMEYFTGNDDPLWTMDDDAILAIARRELAATGLAPARVLDGVVVRAPQAYPIYARGTEPHLARVTDHVRQLQGLQAMGRYGMFKYNNSDHSILTALLSVDNLLGASHDVWAIDADSAYLETRDTTEPVLPSRDATAADR